MCSCIDRINKGLISVNAALDIPQLIDMKTGKTRPGNVAIPVYKLDPRKKGRLPVLLAKYCCFCGQSVLVDGQPDSVPSVPNPPIDEENRA
jgi:hypothetical protein